GLRSRPPHSSAIPLEHRLSAEYCRVPGWIILARLPPEGATAGVFSSCCFHGRKTIGKYLSRTIPPRYACQDTFRHMLSLAPYCRSTFLLTTPRQAFR